MVRSQLFSNIMVRQWRDGQAMRQKSNQRCTQPRPEGGFAIRVYSSQGRGKKMPRLRLKCGCCDESLEIYHDDDFLEINGVIGSVANWREVLLPLLQVKSSRRERTNKQGG